MRGLLIRILATAISFYVTSLLIGGFVLENTWQAYLLASGLFVIISFIVGPIIKLLLLPINLLTLGLFRWASNVIVLYIFDLFYNGLTIEAFHFSGFNSGLFAIPQLDFSLFWTLVLSSLTISLTYSLVASLLLGEE